MDQRLAGADPTETTMFEIFPQLHLNTLSVGTKGRFHDFNANFTAKQTGNTMAKDEKITIFQRYMEFTFKDGEVIKVMM